MVANSSCGTCYTCCVASGVQEIKKYPGQVCKYLDGRDPEKRCSIHATKPVGCARFLCFYRQSDLPEEYRPDKSGVMVTFYENGVTVIITDAQKAGTLQRGKLADIMQLIFRQDTVQVNQVRVINPKNKHATVLMNGLIYRCKILPQKKLDYEGLQLVMEGPAMGKYEIREL